MTRSLPSFLAAVFSFSVAHAAPLDKPADILAAVKAGRSGAWLDDISLKRCLTADVELENLRKRVAIVVEEKQTLCEEIAACDKSLDLARQQVSALQAQLNAREQQTVELQDDLDAWWRSPIFIGAIGFAGGAIAASFAFGALR